MPRSAFAPSCPWLASRRELASLTGLAGLALTLMLALTLLGGCRATRRAVPEPPAPAAEAEFAEARFRLREPDSEGRRGARQAAERAAAIDPGWVAPERMLDDFMREDLLGLEALRRRRAEAERYLGLVAAELRADSSRGRGTPDTGVRTAAASAQYLAGRLEGREGRQRFESAVALDPDLSWGHHGLAWVAAAGGDRELALRHQARAIELARGAWERCFFGAARARLLAASARGDEATELLEGLLADEPAEAERLSLSVQLAGVLMRPGAERTRFGQGYELGLELLYDEELTEPELLALVDGMSFPSLGRSGADTLGELLLALGARDGTTRARIAAELRLLHGPSALSLALLENGNGGEDGEHAASGGTGAAVARRRVRFALGDYGRAVEEWLGSLPRFLLDADGLPRDEPLAELVRSSRGLARAGADPDPDDLERLTESLLAVGWFAEAREVVETLAPRAPDAALRLERRAVAGAVLVRSLERLARAADPAHALLRGAEPVASLDDYLERADPLWRRYGAQLGVSDLGPPLVDSPRDSYGPFGSLVHPGPSWTVAEEQAGRGVAGEPVPGLAHVLGSLGRFGTFGEMLGAAGPDATVLPRVVVEEAAGTHLGVAWRGTIVWCEAAELASRAGRMGARISGAAVHEGYWIDLDGPRRELEAWRALERRFFGEDGASGRVERALATVGLSLDGVNESVRRPERVRVLAALGEASRVRLAILSERRAAGQPSPDLDELARVTAVHEEGHLCDRTRFLPLTKRPLQLMGLLARVGFSARAIQERLEYRAQLVALVDSPEPRIPLADVLDSAGGGEEVTPHGAAYRDLLRDLLRALDRELVSNAAAWPTLDGNRYLVHQLHRLGPEQVRRLSWIVALREGLVENGAVLPHPAPRGPAPQAPRAEVASPPLAGPVSDASTEERGAAVTHN